jgi:hypothetical protein
VIFLRCSVSRLSSQPESLVIGQVIRYHPSSFPEPGGRLMDMATFQRESALNRQAYERLREHIRQEYAGKYVALARGKVFGAADTYDAACALVDSLDEVPEYYLVFPAEVEPSFDLVYDLWRPL